MKKPALLLAFAALAASPAAAQARLLNWDSPSLGTPSVRDLVQGQPAPATPLAMPRAVASSAADNPAPAPKCPDAPELDGRAMRVTLDVQGRDTPLSLLLSYAACVVEYPRDEPPAAPYTRRTYLSATGDVLNVYSSSEHPTSTVSLKLADPVALIVLAVEEPVSCRGH